LNKALLQTDGEFVLVLDADQVPQPHILDRTLGYFDDPDMAFVQTPQYFANVPTSDPLGSQAPLFYGPIQKGKDGWNAAFFCGSNAILRREALMELGVKDYVRSVYQSEDLERSTEALPVMPVTSISVTEDMATAMRLHSMGWKSAYHHETLVLGLAPEDIKTMLTQRLRWAQGTMQVMFRQNPLVQKGLSLAQRLMYFATMWSYLSGFAAVVYLIAPVLYLTLGVLPVKAYGLALFVRLIPFLMLSQAMFLAAGRNCRTWRGQQYSLALFPVWIKSVTSAFKSVYLGKELPFAVTPKVPSGSHKPHWGAVRWQLVMAALLIGSVPVGILRLLHGDSSVVPTGINLIWVAYNLLILSVIVPAARYQGYGHNEGVAP
jgi:cellulose synthase (UDP-forming)